MRKPFAYGVGGVVSADIAVPDHERELGFYSSILTTGDAPLWRDDLTNNRGTPIIGIGARIPEYSALPLQWMPHFQVADVAASAASVLELGGEELMHSKDDDGQSQWAVLVDQVGAAFGVIPIVAAESNSADKSEGIGCISWLTLAVPDALSSREFYQQVVGWGAKTIEIEDGEGRFVNFEMLRDDGSAAAEICHSRGDFEGIPPVWLISLPVDDITESLRRVREGGGEVIKDSAEANYAVIRDPVGVCIALQAG
jgi:predicted enzyme related to lactoylglutathione lyase